MGIDLDRPRRAQDGPTLSFERWYRAEYGRLVAVLIRMGGDRDTAEDVAGEAFSRALERWDRVREMVSPTGWTAQVAFNLLRRRLRRSAMERRRLDSPISSEDESHVGEIWDAVCRLPNRQRQAVLLHYYFDLPYSEVAGLMKMSSGGVGSTLAAARERLAETLAEDADG